MKPVPKLGKDCVYHKRKTGLYAVSHSREVDSLRHIQKGPEKLIYPVLYCRQHRGKPLGHFRHRVLEVSGGLVGLHQGLVVFLPGLPGLHKPLACQFLHDDVGPLGAVRSVFQLGVEIVLAGACPVEHIGKIASYLPGLYGLVDGLRQAVNGDGVAVGCPGANGGVCQVFQVLLGKSQSLQVGSGSGSGLVVPQHAIELPVGVGGFLGGVPSLFTGYLQAAHDFLVFLGFLCQLRHGVHQPGHALHNGPRLEHIAKVGGIVPGVPQGVTGIFRRVLNLLDGLFVNPVDAVFRVPGLVLQTSKGLLGGDNLPLKPVVLVLGNLAPFKLLLYLLFRFPQGIQFFLGGVDGIVEQFILLPQQLGVARIQLQQALHVFELALGGSDFPVNARKSLGKPLSISANLHGDSLNSIRQAFHLPQRTTSNCLERL